MNLTNIQKATIQNAESVLKYVGANYTAEVLKLNFPEAFEPASPEVNDEIQIAGAPEYPDALTAFKKPSLFQTLKNLLTK